MSWCLKVPHRPSLNTFITRSPSNTDWMELWPGWRLGASEDSFRLDTNIQLGTKKEKQLYKLWTACKIENISIAGVNVTSRVWLSCTRTSLQVCRVLFLQFSTFFFSFLTKILQIDCVEFKIHKYTEERNVIPYSVTTWLLPKTVDHSHNATVGQRGSQPHGTVWWLCHHHLLHTSTQNHISKAICHVQLTEYLLPVSVNIWVMDKYFDTSSTVISSLFEFPSILKTRQKKWSHQTIAKEWRLVFDLCFFYLICSSTQKWWVSTNLTTDTIKELPGTRYFYRFCIFICNVFLVFFSSKTIHC